MLRPKKINQSGYTTLDVIFAIVMPSLIVLALITAFSSPNMNERLPISTERLTQVEPSVSDFWEIGVDYGDSADYASVDKLFFIKDLKLVYSKANLSDAVFAIDTARPNAADEFYNEMTLKLEESGPRL